MQLFANLATFSSEAMEHSPEGISKAPPIDRNRELFRSASEETYKVSGETNLSAFIWNPEPQQMPPYPRSVAAFFFSSGWDHGQVSQFAPHCVYLASRGMTTIAFEYRVGIKHGTGPREAMSDARSAIRWIRMNAAELGINPGKIVGVGGSGGAHAIASAVMLKGYDDPADDPTINAAPNALVLFNPVLDTSKDGFGLDRFPDPKAAKAANLINAIAKGLPPMLIMHGTADRVVPFNGSYTFTRKMARKKNKTRLIEFNTQGHGFFNFNLSFEMYKATLGAMDEFFVELGFIEPDPNAGLGDDGLM